MHQYLSEEQSDFAKAIDAFCAREIGSMAKALELSQGGAEEHNQDLYRKLAKVGWLGVVVDEAYGGAGAGAVDMCLLLERLMYGRAPIGGISTTFIAAAAYQRSATEQLRTEVLGGVLEGDVLAISMSEPGSGSDVASLTCKAQKVDGGYLVNGQKTWCSFAHCAESILLVARTDSSGDKHEGITMLHVPIGSDGLAISGIETMGGREVNDLYFTDCFVPDAHVVGEVGQGWSQLITGLNTERLILAAMQLGVAQRAFDDCLKFISERTQFGRPVGTFQVIRHRMADLATEIECTKLLVYSVAHKVDAAPDALFPLEASMAKLKATEVSKRVTLECMQSMGGYGYATEYGMTHMVTQSVVSSIYGGTNEIQREIIGKSLGL